MNNLKDIALKLGIIFLFLMSANNSYAASGDLVVNFENTPLFIEDSFMPGSQVTKWVKVTNNTSDPHAIIVEAINKINADRLGDLMNLRIKENGNVLYDNSLSNFLDGAEMVLSNLPANASTTYNFIVSLDLGANNNYQGKNLGFNLLIGFQGQGGEHTDDGQFSVSSDSSSSGVGGSGGSGGTYQGLLISNDASPLVNGNDVTITWNTSYYSTSQVIFGPESGAPYNLNIALPNFGYASSSPDFLNKVINHSVTIYGLSPGNYLYRVVSHASPPTISFEHSFTVYAGGGALAGVNIGTKSLIQIAQNNARVSKMRTSKNIIPAINNNVGEVASQENYTIENNPRDIEKINFKDAVNLQEEKKIPKELSANNLAAIFPIFDKISESLKYFFLFLVLIGIISVFLIRRKER